MKKHNVLSSAAGLAAVVCLAACTPKAAPQKAEAAEDQMAAVAEEEPVLVRTDVPNKAFYKDEPFVKVFPASQPVQTKWAYGSNFVEMTPTFDQRTHRLIVSSVIDNIGKGAAGQATENLNLMFGLDEKTGLRLKPNAF